MKELRVAFFVVFFSFIMLYLFTKLLGPIPLSMKTQNDLFTVTSTGEVSAKPQTARFSLGVNASGTSAEDVKNQMNKIINQVKADLKALGIQDKDIKTSNFSVNEDVSQPKPLSSSSSTAIGTAVAPRIAIAPISPTVAPVMGNATLDVTTPDVATANKAIDAASKDGANAINGVSFDVTDSDREKYEDQARMDAIKKAKEKAKRIAEAAGIRLGKVVNISESGGVQPVFMSARAADVSEKAYEPTDLQPGENKIQVTVTLSYETL